MDRFYHKEANQIAISNCYVHINVVVVVVVLFTMFKLNLGQSKMKIIVHLRLKAWYK